MRKIAVYTALFGDYSGLIEQPKIDGVDYYCYTDRTDYVSKVWNIVQVPKPISGDDTRSNRYYKILPHLHLDRSYEVSVYIDGNILILRDFSDIVKMALDRAKMACFDHAQNKIDPRDCIYEECEAIKEIALTDGVFKDDLQVMEQQMDRFRQEGYPDNHGLITAPILIRKHFDKDVIKLMEAWWHIVKNESKRDQLSFNYVAWKLDFKQLYLIEGDVRKGNPWFHTISHRQKYRFKVFKVKMSKFFGFR